MVGFKLQQDQEFVLANCWRLARDKQYSRVSVGHYLTDMERKKERDLMVEVKSKNLNRSVDEQSKNLVYKIVGERGRRREILVPLRPGEVLDQEGRVVESELRVGGGRTSWARYSQRSNPNLDHLGERDGKDRALGGAQIRSSNTSVSDLVMQLDKQREQQQVREAENRKEDQ